MNRHQRKRAAKRRMWDKMHGPAGELTEFGHAVVARVARETWEQVRAEQRPALTLVS